MTFPRTTESLSLSDLLPVHTAHNSSKEPSLLPQKLQMFQKYKGIGNFRNEWGKMLVLPILLTWRLSQGMCPLSGWKSHAWSLEHQHEWKLWMKIPREGGACAAEREKVCVWRGWSGGGESASLLPRKPCPELRASLHPQPAKRKTD
jgi:hypothetical protein